MKRRKCLGFNSERVEKVHLEVNINNQIVIQYHILLTLFIMIFPCHSCITITIVIALHAMRSEINWIEFSK